MTWFTRSIVFSLSATLILKLLFPSASIEEAMSVGEYIRTLLINLGFFAIGVAVWYKKEGK